jgi:hypothetical protein
MNVGTSHRPYQELAVDLDVGAMGAITVTLRPPDTEPVTGEFTLPVTARDVARAIVTATRLSEQYPARSLPAETADPLKDIGSRLFAALFHGRRRAVYDRCLAKANAAAEGLRLRLVAPGGAARDLDWIPWEFLYDTRRQDFVALSMTSPIIRQGTPQLQAAPPPISIPARALIVGAGVDPSLGIAEEIKELQAILDPQRDLIRATYVEDATPEHLLKAIHEEDMHIFHFIGTGIPPREGAPDEVVDGSSLVLMRPPGAPGDEGVAPSQVVAADVLLEALRSKANLRLVLLDACYSQGLASRLTAVVPAVLGLRGALSHHACEVFVPAVYVALGLGMPIEAAVTAARQQIDRKLTGSREWGLLTLYLQTSDDVVRLNSAEETVAFSEVDVGGDDERKGDKRLRIRLNVLKQNLQALEEQQSRIGPDVPDFITEQITGARDEIRRINEELGST